MPALMKMVKDHFYKEVSKIMGFSLLSFISCSAHKFPVCLGTNCLTPLFLSSPLGKGKTAFPYFMGICVSVNIVSLSSSSLSIRSLTSKNCFRQG